MPTTLARPTTTTARRRTERALPDLPDLSVVAVPEKPSGLSHLTTKAKEQRMAEYMRRAAVWVETQLHQRSEARRLTVQGISIYLGEGREQYARTSALISSMLSACVTEEDTQRIVEWVHTLPERPAWSDTEALPSCSVESSNGRTTVSTIGRPSVAIHGYPDAALSRIAAHALVQGCSHERVLEWCEEAYSRYVSRADAISAAQRQDASAYLKRRRAERDEVRSHNEHACSEAAPYMSHDRQTGRPVLR